MSVPFYLCFVCCGRSTVDLPKKEKKRKEWVHWSWNPTNHKTPCGAQRAALWPSLPPPFSIGVFLYMCCFVYVCWSLCLYVCVSVCVCAGCFHIWSLSCVFLWVHSHGLRNLFSSLLLQTPLLLPKSLFPVRARQKVGPLCWTARELASRLTACVHVCVCLLVPSLVCRLKWRWILVTELS